MFAAFPVEMATVAFEVADKFFEFHTVKATFSLMVNSAGIGVPCIS